MRAIFLAASCMALALALWAGIAAVPARSTESPLPLIFLASQSGQQTLDADAEGGNPFASALIELLQDADMTLARLPTALQSLTARKSGGMHTPDVPVGVGDTSLRFGRRAASERRLALVIVVSDYAASPGAQSLPGARHDAGRIAAALERSGFNTQIVIDRRRTEFRQALADFAARSALADFAAIYTTGHGVEVGGQVHLLMGDYPIDKGSTALASNSVRLEEIAASARARRGNLVFYGGCRDNPFAK